jgi:nitrogen regulatory protein P-II 1
MKKIEAIVQPFKLEEVKEALKAIGIDGMTSARFGTRPTERATKRLSRAGVYRRSVAEGEDRDGGALPAGTRK